MKSYLRREPIGIALSQAPVQLEACRLSRHVRLIKFEQDYKDMPIFQNKIYHDPTKTVVCPGVHSICLTFLGLPRPLLTT